MKVLQVTSHLLAICRQSGIGSACRWAIRTMEARYRERVLGITTERTIELSEFGIENPECKEYAPTEYCDFRRMMQVAGVVPDGKTFVDFGAGMGRAVVLAAEYPFRRVVGVELVPELAEAARQNLRRCRQSLACRDVDIVTADATVFEIPADAGILYFNNPFNGAVLTQVLNNASRFCASVSPDLVILCNVPLNSGFEGIVRQQPWIEIVREIKLSEARKCLVCRPRSGEWAMK